MYIVQSGLTCRRNNELAIRILKKKVDVLVKCILSKHSNLNVLLTKPYLIGDIYNVVVLAEIYYWNRYVRVM